MTEATVTKKSKNLKAPKLFPDELIDQLLAQVQGKDAESILGESGLAGQLRKQLAERMLAAGLNHHLETESEQGKAGNHRNGTSPKTVLTPSGELKLDIPRERQATSGPQLVGKYQRRLPGFDDHVISMYARGMSVREIQGHLLELYGLQVSPGLISTITDEVLADVEEWQQRPLEAMYPIVYFDALRLKIRDEGTVRNKAVYLALGIRADGRKEVPGLWIEQTEGAKFWLKVFNELKNRGLHDILIAVVDGLRGFPEAIEAVYPAAQIQTCIVHLIRNSLNLAGWKDRQPLAAALDAFAQGEWGRKFPTVAAMWQRQWEQVIPFFAYPPEMRRIVYTTNAIESMHMQWRKIVKNRGHFPSDEAASKLLYLAFAQHRKGLEDAACHLAASSQPVRHPVRRTIHLRHQLRFLTGLSTQDF
ncbi:transposase, Mutator family protein [Paraburkholderia xenovorans LB400]|uniref:Mutator family transposase n=1 Tax=Paraburkholderia xenovorans (strain LB400) TaxID=266265 RepID=Q13I74_PARXL|nr:Putative transposase, mutator type [Paraburkholderia xenovorans LB400]AIP34382.1 transposase, Mutator family protein [Paraburkholderia xenovorans LB400]